MKNTALQLKALLTNGRKGEAYDKALLTLLIFAGLAYGSDWSLSENELDSLLMGLAGILATFVSGNAAEHWTTRGKATPVAAIEAPEPAPEAGSAITPGG